MLVKSIKNIVGKHLYLASMQRLGFSTSATREQRKLAVDTHRKVAYQVESGKEAIIWRYKEHQSDQHQGEFVTP